MTFYLPTILLENPEGAYGMEKILGRFEKGVYHANSTKDVLKILEEKIEIPTRNDVEKVWKKDSSTNFLRELKKIMKY